MIIADVFVPGIPQPAPRARARVITRPGQKPIATVYAAKEDKDWRMTVRLVVFQAMRAERQGPCQGPVFLQVYFQLPRPASVSVKKRRLPTVKPDLDNLVKSVKDAVKGVAWIDDCQVVRLAAFKDYDLVPGAKITIDTLE